MTNYRKSKILVVLLFSIGAIAIFFGLTKGLEMAETITHWRSPKVSIIPNGLINGCTYTPIIIGIALLILGIIFSVIMFLKQYEKKQ